MCFFPDNNGSEMLVSVDHRLTGIFTVRFSFPGLKILKTMDFWSCEIWQTCNQTISIPKRNIYGARLFHSRNNRNQIEKGRCDVSDLLLLGNRILDGVGMYRSCFYTLCSRSGWKHPVWLKKAQWNTDTTSCMIFSVIHQGNWQSSMVRSRTVRIYVKPQGGIRNRSSQTVPSNCSYSDVWSNSEHPVR